MSSSLLFTTLCDALWRGDGSFPSTLTDKETEKLLSQAEKQAVSGLVVDTLFRHDVRMPQQWVFESVGLLE